MLCLYPHFQRCKFTHYFWNFQQMGVENISTFFIIAVRDLKNRSGIVHFKKKIVPLQVSNLKSITTTNKDYE